MHWNSDTENLLKFTYFFSKVILIVMFVNLKMIVYHSGVKIPGTCVLKKEHGEEYKAII